MSTPDKTDSAEVTVPELDVKYRSFESICRSVAAWHDQFYSNPKNRAAYAEWCKKHGLEYDLQEPPPER